MLLISQPPPSGPATGRKISNGSMASAARFQVGHMIISSEPTNHIDKREMTILSSLVAPAPEFFMTRTPGVTSNDNVGIVIDLGFQSMEV